MKDVFMAHNAIVAITQFYGVSLSDAHRTIAHQRETIEMLTAQLARLSRPGTLAGQEQKPDPTPGVPE